MSTYGSAKEFFEDYAVGEEIETGARTITETDIVFWSAIVGDWNPAHVDIEHAKRSPFGGRIAHGNIALNLSVALAARCAPGLYRPKGYVGLSGWETVRFTAPVMIGDTIRAQRKLTALEPAEDADCGTLVYEVSVLNQRDEPVMVGKERLVVRKRARRSGD
jgi:acyl dehydratase